MKTQEHNPHNLRPLCRISEDSMVQLVYNTAERVSRTHMIFSDSYLRCGCHGKRHDSKLSRT